MGVLGLSTFITEQKPKLLRHHRLHNNHLVVDAYNLCHYLYYNFQLQVRYNGQYEQFSRHLRQFLQTLIDCRIEVVMIFDGAYNDDDRKLETTIKRFENRLITAVKVAKGNNGSVLPILARQVFVHVLKDLGIQNLTCDFEADYDLASLANHYQCPILSNDSDFYIYNLSHGFLPLDYLDITKYQDDDGDYYINVKIYRTDWLLEEFKCKDHRLLGLWATIVGNDFISSERLAGFYNMLNLPDRHVKYRVGKHHVTVPRGKERIARILRWLQMCENFQYALDTVLTAVKTEADGDLQECVLRNIDSYSVGYSGLVDYIENGQITTENSPLYDRIPHKLLRRFRDCQIDPEVFNIFLTRRVWLMPQIEDFNEKSSYTCSRGLREIVYALMRESDRHTDYITEYDRHVQNVVKTTTEPKVEVGNYGTLPNLRDLFELPEDEKWNILYCCLECHEFAEKVREKRGFFEAVCAYWIRNCDRKPESGVIQALLLSYVKVEIVDKLREQKTEDIGQRIPPANLLQNIAQKFGQIKSKNLYSKDQSLTILHSLAQFKACFLAASQLLQILDITAEIGLSPKFYDGLLIHNLCLKLNKHIKTREIYIMEILGGNTCCVRLEFEEIMNNIRALTGNDIVTVSVSELRVTSLKSRKKKKKNERKVTEKTVESDDHEEISRLKANCKISNKFQSLTLCDD